MFEKHIEYLTKETHMKRDFWNINQWIFKFPNGYGASVVCHIMGNKIITYGSNDNPYELAVLDIDGMLCYDTPIADDVVGYLTEEDVEGYLDRIMELKEE